MNVERPAASAPRTIRINDVVKALDIAAERLGDADRSCATLKAWAAAGRVTPAGQLLTTDAVAKGIEIWLAQRDGKVVGGCSKSEAQKSDSSRKPPTPLTKTSTTSRNKRPAEDSKEAVKEIKEVKEVKAVKEVAKTAAVDVPATKKQKKETEAPVPAKGSYAERVKERKEQEARMRELTSGRFKEVLKEIQGHMEEILQRTGPKALKEFQDAPEDVDRRELYMRLVHAEQESEVQQPEELKAQLMPYQVEGLEWLVSLYVNNLHGILADEMGLGKTIQTISLLLWIQEHKRDAGPHLIVAPKSCLGNWEAEFERFAPHWNVHTLSGDQDARDAGIAALKKDVSKGKASVCLTNYEQVYRNDYLSKNDWHLVIVDEGHRLKNPDTVLHKAMAQLKCKMRLLLTGTPLQNSLNELWALLHYLLPDLFTHMMDFKAWFAQPFKGSEMNEFELQMDPEQEQQVIQRMHSLLAPFLLQRVKSDVLSDKLPPRVEINVRVPLSAWQRAAYSDLEKKTIKLLGDDDSVSSEQVNNALMQLRKIVLHPYLFQDKYQRDQELFRTSGKVEALDRILSKLVKFGHKVLIFSQFTSVLDILEEYLKWKRLSCVRLDGQVAHAERRERIDRFNADPKLNVFLLSARAGGLGLNLQSADTVILFDLDWNPQNDKQAIARVHRVGQKNEVRVVRLVSDSAVERHMEQRCAEKLEMEQKIMGAGMFRKTVTQDMRRQALRSMLGLSEASKASATSAEGSDLTSPQELSEQLARSDEERKAFVDMDTALLKLKKNSATTDPSLLERCGRLMSPSEVPDGFTGLNSD
eukprot:TRINITY_DN9549_c2_g3_i1.p1 TRINITY_DN9549_c2_g3~~TRINITY_DN9549_c2_g3_i1.p1  ORF type:complete len:811 (-),score=185.72 TRINITY_DN9549_c2_g3_i1:145-2577(-)